MKYTYTTYQRKSDNRWVASIDKGKKLNGKRDRKVVYGDTQAEVIALANVIVFELQTGEYVEKSKDTLIGFLESYYQVSLPKWEETTAYLYRSYIDIHFEPYFKSIKLSEIKPIVLDTFYNYKLDNKEEKKRPVGLNTVRKLNTFLKSAFNYAIKNGLMRTNPAINVLLKEKKKYEPVIYNESQFSRLLAEVSGNAEEVPILLAGGCGLRRGEVFGLRWKNIDFKNNTITIEETYVRTNKYIEKKPKNTTSQRTFKSPSFVMATLLKYRGKPDEKVVSKWKPDSFTQHFAKILSDFGMEHIRFHDLRHYNAVIMCKYGIPDKVAAERLGHSNVQTLRHVYQHVLEDMDETAANEIDAMLERKTEQPSEISRDKRKTLFRVV